MIRIGAGNKAFDLFSTALNGVILISMLVASFFNSAWLSFFGIFLLVSGIHILLNINRYYIFIKDDSILIDHIFKKRRSIKRSLYEGLKRPALSFPLSNELCISFKNGEVFRFMGGVSRINDLDKKIKG